MQRNQVQIRLKKAELNLREKAQEVIDLQERNQRLQTQLNDLRSQEGIGHSDQVASSRHESFDLIRTRILDILENDEEQQQSEHHAQEASMQQQIQNYQQQIMEFQQRMLQYEEEKAVAESKIHEMEQLIQQQFDIIQDYSNQIEQHDARGQQQSFKISVLEHDLHQLIDNKYRESVVFMQKVEEQQAEQEAQQMLLDEEQQNEESLSYNSENAEVSKRIDQSDSTSETASANDQTINMLKDDMDSIEMQFNALALPA